ncbi:ADP-ribosyltransferase [Streptomyces sp. 4N509B]|uniref:ADP-ribosyltransferase n=1 Tax=Streptomyces sp. 4N509B TaxID=3457413 RepID=UPI003FD51421
MITRSVLQRLAVVLALLALSVPAHLTVARTATAVACPTVSDPLHAAADRTVDVDRITPDPAYRANCHQLYRADGRSPAVVFAEGFHPWDTVNGQYDLEAYVLQNQPSPFVSTTYDHDLYKDFGSSTYNYYIDAPGGIDVNETIGDDHKYAHQVEVAFPGGIDRSFIVGACPIDRQTDTEIMSACVDNPHYDPWRN